MRDDELLDDILDEVEALQNQLPRAQLAPLFEERARGLAPGAPGRAAWLTHAAEQWELSGDPARAKACYEQAAQDGGETYIDPRAEMLGVLFQLGETSRVDELLAELRRDLRAGWEGRYVHAMVGESLEENGRLEEALRWFSAGLTRSEREDPENSDITCLNGRFRVRRELGLPMDRYDHLCEERRREYAAELEEEQRLLDLAPGEAWPEADARSGESPRLAVLYWPEAELQRMLQRWPDLVEDYGADQAEHRSRVEHHLRSLAHNGGRVVVAPGHLDDLLRYAEGRGDKAGEPGTRAAYAAHLAHAGSVLAWPPGRNERCWCGSGLKYKKCCGALR